MAFGAPARKTALAAAGANLVIGLLLMAWFEVGKAGYQFAEQRTVWAAPVTGLPVMGFNVGLDGMSLVMVLLTVIVTLAAVWQKPAKEGGEGMFYASSLLIAAGAMGAFVSTDLVFFFAFHELALIPTFIMVGIWGLRDRNYAAMKMTIYLTVGAMLSLLGLITLYVKSGANTFDLIALKEAIAAQGLAAATQHYAFGLLMFGFGILVSLWPLHTWAPLGYGAAPTSTVMLHAGVLKKFGLYGLIQIAVPLLPAGAAAWAWKLALLAGIGNVLVVGFVTMAQRDLKQMLGYSSVMHMGYCFLGIAALSTVGTGKSTAMPSQSPSCLLFQSLKYQ